MIVFISDIDTAKLLFLRQKITINLNTSVDLYVKGSEWSLTSEVIPEVVTVTYRSCCLQEIFIIRYKSQFKWAFTKVIVTRAGHL